MNKSAMTAAKIASALGSALLLPMLAQAAPATPPSYQYEKCYGVNAAGKNDCAATGSHSCAGQGTHAKDPQSWIFLPTGSCEKIQGGSLKPKS